MDRQAIAPTGLTEEEAAELRADIEQYSRRPFQKLLHKLLKIPLNDAALEEWANDTPDRYLQAVTMALKAAGFNDTTVHLNVTGDINSWVRTLQQMSDAQLRLERIKLNTIERPALPSGSTNASEADMAPGHE